MKKPLILIIIISIVCSIVILGCEEKKTYPRITTPQEAWDEMIYVWKHEDADRLYNLLCEDAKAKTSAEAAKDVFEQMKSAGFSESDYDLFEVTNIREEGNTAYVEFTIEGYSEGLSEYIFVKENGEWKLKE